MLTAIQEVHNKGYIHRDIKPSNFVIGTHTSRNQIYLVDFGLAKIHLKENGIPIEESKNMKFHGTIAYASLNTHNRQDLSRRDDLWSWYFVMLEFFKEKLAWRYSRTMTMDEVKEMKAWCMDDPESYLWCGNTREMQEIRKIFHKIKELKYTDTPDYEYIREQLKFLLQKEEGTFCSLSTRELVPVLC
jgi:serine/threonine protein kinase